MKSWLSGFESCHFATITQLSRCFERRRRSRVLFSWPPNFLAAFFHFTINTHASPATNTMKEKDLLSSFLLGNELHDSVTLQQFTHMFPPAFRTHPEVKDLYRAYLNSRHQVKTKIKRNIDIEVRRNPFHLAVDQASGQDASSSSKKRGDDLDNMNIEVRYYLHDIIVFSFIFLRKDYWCDS